jgi:post-segregation antitoxin (ccd killing protein)
MSEKKAVLNVTVPQGMAEAVREEAAARGVTISSVVEAALAEQLKWYKIRAEGLAAMDELFQEIGYPTPEEAAEAAAWNDEVERELVEALAADDRDAAARQAGHRSAGAA